MRKDDLLTLLFQYSFLILFLYDLMNLRLVYDLRLVFVANFRFGTSKYFLSYSSGWVPSTILLLNIKLIHFVMFQIDFILDLIWAVFSSKVQRKEIKALYTRKHNPKFGPENKKCRMMNYDSPLEPTAVSERCLNSLCLLIF